MIQALISMTMYIQCIDYMSMQSVYKRYTPTYFTQEHMFMFKTFLKVSRVMTSTKYVKMKYLPSCCATSVPMFVQINPCVQVSRVITPSKLICLVLVTCKCFYFAMEERPVYVICYGEPMIVQVYKRVLYFYHFKTILVWNSNTV